MTRASKRSGCFGDRTGFCSTGSDESSEDYGEVLSENVTKSAIQDLNAKIRGVLDNAIEKQKGRRNINKRLAAVCQNLKGLAGQLDKHAQSRFKTEAEIAAVEHAATSRHPTHGGIETQIHMAVERIAEIDTVAGTFKGQVLITYRWPCPEGEDPPSKDEDDGDWQPLFQPKLRFRNYQEECISQQTTFRAEEIDGTKYVRGQLRVFLTFNEPLELQSFPTDCQTLSIVLECRQPLHVTVFKPFIENGKQLPPAKFIVDRSDLGDFELVKEMPYVQWMYIADNHHMKVSRIQLEVKMVRRANYYIYNVVSVTFLVISLAFAAFGLHPGDVPDRLDTLFNLFLTVVAFRIVLSSMLPAVSYTTRLDLYVLVSSLFLLVQIVQATVSPFLHFKKIEMSAITEEPEFFPGSQEQDLIDADMTKGFILMGTWCFWNVAFFFYSWWKSRAEYTQFVRESQKLQSDKDGLSHEAIDKC